MKTFKLSGRITVSVYTEVEAETLEEAIEFAGERDIERVEWNRNYLMKHAWVNDEFDGEVVDIVEEK